MGGGGALLLAVALGASARAADAPATPKVEPVATKAAAPVKAAAPIKAATSVKAAAPAKAEVPQAEAPAKVLPAKADVPVAKTEIPAKAEIPAKTEIPAATAPAAAAAGQPAVPLAAAPGASNAAGVAQGPKKNAKAKNKKTAADAVAPPAVASAAPAVDNTAYDPTGRRDPFRPPRVNQLLASGGERTPLQRYELGQLRLVAVIYDTGDARAVVEDEGGLGYIIKVGTKIGVNDGVVRGIERGKVLVEEVSMDFFGERRSSEVVLEMASGERGNR
jgi:type IV pilus assembly protein PilP